MGCTGRRGARALHWASFFAAATFMGTAAHADGEANITSNKFEMEIGTGYASFPDLQVPLYNPRQSLRADGAVAPNATAQHQGVAMQVYGGGSHRWNSNFYSRLGLGLVHGSGLIGEPSTGGATYLRYGLIGETELSDGRAVGYHPLVSLGVDWSRGKYINVSELHYADTVVPFGRIGVRNGRLTLRGSIGASTSSAFGYEGGKRDSAQRLPGSSSYLVRYGADGNYVFNRSTSLTVGLEVETLDVTIRDVQRYQEFGLVPYPELHHEQHYVLTTNMVLFGLNRMF